MRDVTNVLSRVAATMRRERLLEPGDGVLVACSGGHDSLCLLDVLLRLRAGLQLGAVEAAYVDHGLRAGAAEEARAVVALAAQLGARCEIVRVAEALAGARSAGASPEEAARAARYAALGELARRRDLAAVAVGHTRSDQAETALLRLVSRGRLEGMPYRRGGGAGARVIRPLLDVGAIEVLRYLRARELVPLYDETNANPEGGPRNRLRLEVMPLLRRLNPQIERAVAKALRGPGQDQRPAPRSVPPAVRPRPPEERAVVLVTGPGRYSLGGVQVRLRLRERGGLFALDEVGLPLVLRGLRPGERMRPRGGTGTKKIVRLWRDARVPPPARAGVVLALPDERGGEVLWAPGLRPSERGRPEAGAAGGGPGIDVEIEESSTSTKAGMRSGEALVDAPPGAG